MNLLLLMVSGDAPDDEPEEDKPDAATRRARRLLDDALRRNAPAEPPAGAPKIGQQVDKYFGTKLPPVCEKLGCYLTDDGKRYYCVNSACQKHKKRATKHTRPGRGKRAGTPFVYFRCPRCGNRDVDMHLITNEYSCRACQYIWKR